MSDKTLKNINGTYCKIEFPAVLYESMEWEQYMFLYEKIVESDKLATCWNWLQIWIQIYIDESKDESEGKRTK